jgi:hypothetical protein
MLPSQWKTLVFKGIPLEFLDADGQLWLRTRHLGQALGFTDPTGAVSGRYTRQRERFAGVSRLACVSELTPLRTGRVRMRPGRLYSIAGAALMASITPRGPNATEFLAWLEQVRNDV